MILAGEHSAPANKASGDLSPPISESRSGDGDPGNHQIERTNVIMADDALHSEHGIDAKLRWKVSQTKREVLAGLAVVMLLLLYQEVVV